MIKMTKMENLKEKSQIIDTWKVKVSHGKWELPKKLKFYGRWTKSFDGDWRFEAIEKNIKDKIPVVGNENKYHKLLTGTWKKVNSYSELRKWSAKNKKPFKYSLKRKLAIHREGISDLNQKWQEVIDLRLDLNCSGKTACPSCGNTNNVLLEEGRSKKIIAYTYQCLPCPHCKYHCHLCHKEVYTIHDSGTFPEEYYTFEYEGMPFEESKGSLKQTKKYWEGVFNRKYQRLRKYFKKEHLPFTTTTNLKSNEKVISDCKKRIKLWLNEHPELKEKFYDKKTNVVRRGTDHCQVCGNLIRVSKHAWNKRYCSEECGLIAQHNKFVEQRRNDVALLECSKEIDKMLSRRKPRED